LEFRPASSGGNYQRELQAGQANPASPIHHNAGGFAMISIQLALSPHGNGMINGNSPATSVYPRHIFPLLCFHIYRRMHLRFC
jgi:hypothetical protein